MIKKEERLRLLFFNPLTAWIIGILLAFLSVFLNNASGSKLITMAEYFLFEYDYKMIEYSVIFPAVLLLRAPILILVALSGNMKKWKHIGWVISFLYGFSMGYLCIILSMEYKLKGILLCIFMWSPQMLFYLFSIGRWLTKENHNLRENILLFLFYLLGILGEVFINPLLIGSITIFM